MKPFLAVAISLLLSACAPSPASDDSPAQSSSPPTTRYVDGCPVTVPPSPGFVPPEPYPSEPGFEQVWYGTADLWTVLDRSGAVWRDLPVGTGPHAVGDKTLWFSEKFSTAEGEDFSGDADITVTAMRLDGSPSKVVEKGGGPSFNRHIKNFMLVGLGFPEPGCWRVTATYQGTELSYVLFVAE